MTLRVTIICVTGTRHATQRVQSAVWETLAGLLVQPIVILYHGAAPGADTYAHMYGMAHKWTPRQFPYLKCLDVPGGPKLGGPIRNVEFVAAAHHVALELQAESHWLAFPAPDARGTRDAMRVMERFGHVPREIKVTP